MPDNELGQPVGQLLSGWAPRLAPSAPVLKGRYCRLERLDSSRHAEELFEADRHDTTGESWTYLPYGPFGTLADYRRWVEGVQDGEDPRFYAIVSTERPEVRAVGVLGLLRIQPEFGVIEVGHVHYSPLLQRHRAATEAQYLLAAHVFEELGYRRFEWKCDALNAASRAAAQRLGFSYEGTFRQAVVVKGRNRDTAWYSMIDSEWPGIRDRFEAWLRPENFTGEGRQRSSLGPA
ncbi:GNAT family N-acetyltransferase [Sciscionella marina]|uniref:GNAT family N-acetyltransferase n=1 Tax=Sciscionella marina TaxID=508770 RepID=UPI00058C98FE|nr:GNAT family protein [Sciscionella marina]